MADGPVRKEHLENRQARSRPLVFYLVAVVLAILIPALIVALVLLNRTSAAQEDVLRALTNATAQAIGHSVDREIAGMTTTLRVLSTSGFLRSGNFAEFHDRSVQALAGTGTYMIAVDDADRQLLNTRVPFGSEMGPTSDGATAALARERGVATVSGVFYGQVAQDYVFNVWMPLRDEGPIRLLALTQNARNLGPALQSRQLPAGWHAALVDADNVVVAATANADLDTGAVLPLRQNDDVADRDRWVTEQLNGQNIVTAEWRSGVTGWRIIAWASAESVNRPLGDSLMQLAAWGFIIVLAAIAVAFLIAQRIGTSIRGLRLDAQRLGRGEAVFPRNYPVREAREVSLALAESSSQRQRAERDVRFLMRELAHRSKNQMAVIAAMAKQTAHGATDVPTYVAALERRIMGLARSTDLLLAHGREGVSLAELIDLQLAPFRPPEADRVRISGEDIRINPQGAQILGMAMHELATNATRYGAFFDEEGHLSLDWTSDAQTLTLTWRERLSHRLGETNRSGFGTVVLRTMVGGALRADVTHTAHEDGVEWQFRIPLASLDPAFAAARPDEGMEDQ
jgi:two-component sensor histidine kinase